MRAAADCGAETFTWYGKVGNEETGYDTIEETVDHVAKMEAGSFMYTSRAVDYPREFLSVDTKDGLAFDLQVEWYTPRPNSKLLGDAFLDGVTREQARDCVVHYFQHGREHLIAEPGWDLRLHEDEEIVVVA